ncbi:hypothetical protein QQ045_018132 [Rhodiola kirilowii]
MNLEPTIGVEVNPLDFLTTRGPLRFYCWDTADQQRFRCLRDGYYINGDCAIIMFDVTARLTYQNVLTWYRDLCRVCGNIPIVLCGNKVDASNRQVEAKLVTFHRKKNLQYCEISAKSNYNCSEPFLYLARKFMDSGLRIYPDLEQAEPPIDMAQRRMIELWVAHIATVPLPDDDDDFK